MWQGESGRWRITNTKGAKNWPRRPYCGLHKFERTPHVLFYSHTYYPMQKWSLLYSAVSPYLQKRVSALGTAPEMLNRLHPLLRRLKMIMNCGQRRADVSSSQNKSLFRGPEHRLRSPSNKKATSSGPWASMKEFLSQYQVRPKRTPAEPRHTFP